MAKKTAKKPVTRAAKTGGRARAKSGEEAPEVSVYATTSNAPPREAARLSKAVVTPSSTGADERRNPVRGGAERVLVRRGAAALDGAGEEGVAAGSEWSPPARAWTVPSGGAGLRDVAEATFGPPPPQPESVIAEDQRVRIEETGVFPWRAIASLLITAADNSNWIGTGWFVSPRVLVTAGHCVFIHSGDPQRHGWVKSISVMPGRDADQLPFGAVTASDFRSVSGWTTNRRENFDYAGIIIPTPLGDQVGTFGFGAYPDGELRGALVNISGYPGDKEQGTQWYDRREVVQVNSHKVYYDIDTAGGQSGAPVWRVVDERAIAVAIHAYGVGGGVQSNS